MSDPFFNNVVSLLHFELENSGGEPIDTIDGNTWERAGGDAFLSQDESLYGDQSLAIEGSTSRLYQEARPDLYFSGTWTLEIAFRIGFVGGGFHGIFQQGLLTSQGRRFQVFVNSAGQLTILVVDGDNGNRELDESSAAGIVQSDQWHQLCVEKDELDITVYLDGTIVIQGTMTDEWSDSFADLRLGYSSIAGSGGASDDAYFDEWRFTRDVIRYGGAYTPATEAFPDIGAGITITEQPQSTQVYEDATVTFTVDYTPQGGNDTFQWFKDGVAIPNSNSIEYTVGNTSLEDNGDRYSVRITNEGGDTILSESAVLSVVAARSALVWNFEDDNFSWMDAAHDSNGQLVPVRCMKYQFDPGFQVRWDDLENWGATWEDLTNEGTRWADFYNAGNEENMYWLTPTALLISDQYVKTRNSVKRYYARRDQIDFSDTVQGFSTENWIYGKQMYFHLQSRLSPTDDRDNSFSANIGWQDSMMDEPDFNGFDVINLQRVPVRGKVKWDFRVTGRYLSMEFDFTQTEAIEMTGAEIDIEQTYGR